MDKKTILSLAVTQRNRLFLDACFAIHFIFMFIFYLLGAKSMTLINLISSLFYGILIFGFKSFLNIHIVLAYFEILLYATAANYILGPSFGFDLYILGMVSVIHQLASFTDNRKYFYMLCGFGAYIISWMWKDNLGKFGADRLIMLNYKEEFFMVNLIITIVFVVVSSYLFDQNASSHIKHLNEVSSVDPLTGIWNRRGIEKFIKDNEEDNYCIAILDIDFFKKVNDTYGHDVGDLVLKKIGQTLRRSLRNHDACARWGGEEFVLYISIDDVNIAKSILERITNQIRNLSFDLLDLKVTVTCGAAMKNENTFEQALKLADDRLYKGKENGRNQIVIE